ncbi:mechanosensitive ion channel family protein [Isoptericola variabilis]|uniref:mechanosensitive ion channel family protein n=1 Tax=Isoptericola variabilis TaxID=139208 RepID=UPI0002DE7AE4|nr:mechanosensitive ion channel family protein [Isoptericola variabilis]
MIGTTPAAPTPSLPLLAAPAATAPSPEPSTSSTADDVLRAGEDAWAGFWEWFSGWPLRVLIILAVGALLLVLLRRAISHVTERIATGSGTTTTDPAPRRRLLRRAPLVEDALTAANPLASARRAQRARTVGSVLRSAANIIVGTLMALMVLQELDVNVGPLLASAGVAGVALGFGAQSLVKDFISGIFLLVEDQFGVGDVVDLGSGAVGTVEEVQLRTTQVRSFDGTLWYVRNGEILRAGNRTQQWARALAEVRVPVDADLDVVRAALGRAADAVHADPELTGSFLEAPSVRGVDAVHDFTLTFTLHAQVQPGQQWDVSRALLRAAQAELRAAGVLRAGETVEASSDAAEA